MATLTVSDIEQSRILMLASYSNSSNDLRTSLSGSGWEPVPVAGEALFTDNPFLIAPVTAFAARQGDTLAIAFQGTNENVDWLSNVVGGQFSWAPLYAAYGDFFDGLFEYLRSSDAADISKILVTGHSQGGAIVEFFMDLKGSMDERYVAVTYASPGIEGRIDDLGSGRVLRIEHTDDIVVDIAERGGLGGSLVAPELDLRVELGENSAIPGGSEHGSGVYAATARILFTSPFAEEILRDYDSLTFAIQGNTNDEMYGDNASNVLFGQGGQDSIFGGGGRDLISGGEGADDLRGEDGDDEIYGGASFDFLFGGYGDDSLHGGDSFDYLYGEAGSDTLDGGAGNDYLYGGDGNDYLYGGDGDDHLFGQKGDDLIDGGAGEDTAYFGFLGDAYSFSIIRQQGSGGVGIRVEQQHLGGASPFTDTNGSATIYQVETLNIDGVGLFSTSDLSSRERVIAVGGNSSEVAAKETGSYDRYWINAGEHFAFSAEQSLYEEIPSLTTGPSSFAVRRTDTGEVFEFISELNFVSFADGQVQSVNGAFTPVVDPEPTDDHGDTRNTATLVTDLDGTAVRGEIEVSGDEDYFRFSTQSGQTYGVVATPDNSGVDPEIRVYNSSGQLVEFNADLGSGPSAGLSFTSSGGTYYVEISGEGGSIGDYGIGVSLLSDGSGGTAQGDASEPDANVDISTGRQPTHEGNNDDDSWVFSSSSSTEVFIAGYGGNDIIRTGQRDDIVFGGDGDDEIQTRDGDDIIDGGDDEDDIEGGDGNDGIAGGRDDDTIDGGDGDDVIAGQHGDDRIDGGDDDDVISGGDGDDRIDGESGDDGILGDDGDDNLRGGTGDDAIYGGDDDDYIDGEQGRDVLYGDRGRDFIRGGEDADRIDGGDHDDELLGEEGNDSISGGSGDDVIRPGAGDDTADGDGGSDTLSYESMNGGATIDMTTEEAYGAEIGFDRFDSIDHIIGTNGNDIIIGDGDDNRLDGDSGQDIITGGAGDDEIDGGSSTDTAVFSGNRADYTITASTNPEFDLQIVDNRPGSPDGTDLLDSIAFLQFADVRIRDDDALSSTPTANDDVFEVSNDGPAILDILGNDTDPDGNTLSVSAILSQPAIGLAYIVDDRIVFDPNGEFSGDGEQIVSITYRMSDGTGLTDEATITVTVLADESGPEVTTETQTYSDGRVLVTTFVDGVRKEATMTDVEDSYSWTSNTNYYNDEGERVLQTFVYDNGNVAEKTFLGGQLIQNVVIEADGDVRTTAYDAQGVRETIVFEDVSDGRDWTRYTNEYDDTGTLVLKTHEYEDGNRVIRAYDGDVSITGSVSSDSVYGGDGEDRMSLGNDNDLAYGEMGNDYMLGGNGNDTIFGGSGDDFISSGNDDDYVSGGSNNDLIRGGDGRDTLYGGNEDDHINGGNNNDTIYGDNDRDVLFGQNGADLIYGGAGIDRSFGGDGADTFFGGTGNDAFTGGGNNTADQFNFFLNDGNDRILDFEVGVDEIVFRGTGLDFDDLVFIDKGAEGCVVRYNGSQRIVLKGVDIDDIQEEDFVFFI